MRARRSAPQNVALFVEIGCGENHFHPCHETRLYGSSGLHSVPSRALRRPRACVAARENAQDTDATQSPTPGISNPAPPYPPPPFFMRLIIK
jgi:hypothetical protein